MRFWKGILVTLVIAVLASPAAAQFTDPAIGVYFDEQATSQYGTFEGGISQYHTAYVFAVNMNQMVGGMAFMLVTDPAIHLTSTEFPHALGIGDPKAGGCHIGFYDCQPGWGGQPVMGCVLNLWTGTTLVQNGELRVVAHPNEGGIMISDCDGQLMPVTGLTSFLTITVDNDDATWGAVKTLYR